MIERVHVSVLQQVYGICKCWKAIHNCWSKQWPNRLVHRQQIHHTYDQSQWSTYTHNYIFNRHIHIHTHTQMHWKPHRIDGYHWEYTQQNDSNEIRKKRNSNSNNNNYLLIWTKNDWFSGVVWFCVDDFSKCFSISSIIIFIVDIKQGEHASSTIIILTIIYLAEVS